MKTVYSNDWFRVVERSGMFWIEEDGSRHGAAILVVVDDSDLLLLQVRRAPHTGLQLEIPRGYAEQGESSVDCACREAAEETGYRVVPSNLTYLGAIKPNSSILASRVSVYAAKVSASDRLSDPDDEVEAVQRVPLAQLNELISNGQIEDSFTLSALTLYRAKLESLR